MPWQTNLSLGLGATLPFPEAATEGSANLCELQTHAASFDSISTGNSNAMAVDSARLQNYQ